ncbi:MAG: hypothetical protein ACKVWV_01190 [Planctomycetota bacterium]
MITVNSLSRKSGAEQAQTSPPDPTYNCIAWAAGDMTRFWWPTTSSGAYWPEGIQRTDSVAAFITLYEGLGYVVCRDGVAEEETEKIAIYADVFRRVKHAARQLPSGRWTSKLGKQIDIEHGLNGLDGPRYGAIVVFMKRPRAVPSSTTSNVNS